MSDLLFIDDYAEDCEELCNECIDYTEDECEDRMAYFSLKYYERW